MLDLAGIVTDRVVRHLSSLAAQRASDTERTDDAIRGLTESLPEKGSSLEPLLNLFFGRVLPKGYNTAGPGMLSYINGGGLFQAALADYIASAVNPYVGYWHASPGCTRIETPWSGGSRRSWDCRRRQEAFSRPADRWRTSRRSSRLESSGSEKTSPEA